MNLLDLYPSARLVSSSNQEYNWHTCPYCGTSGKHDSDRFVFWPYRKNGGTFWCRHCDRQGDAIQLVRDTQGKSFHEARAIVLGDASFPALRIQAACPRPAVDARPSAPEPATNQHQWRSFVDQFLKDCQSDLTGGPHFDDVCKYIYQERGLCPKTCLDLHIGWNTERREVKLSQLGIKSPDPDAVTYLAKGIVILSRWNGQTIGAYIHIPKSLRVDKSKKGHCIKGNGRLPFIAKGKSNDIIFLFESALDACLVWQEMGGLYSCLAFNGGTKKKLERHYIEFVNSHKMKIIVIDYDENEAGKNNGEKISDIFPDARTICPIPPYVDLGKMHIDAMTHTENDKLWDIKKYMAKILPRLTGQKENT